MDVSKKSLSVTAEQKKLMLEFIRKNPKLISGNFTSDFTQIKSQNLWQNLTTILNSYPGPHKHWKAWRKTWQDIRSRTKTKAKHKIQYSTQPEATGGGIFENIPISPFEAQVLDIINRVSTEGHTSASETKVEFEYEVPQHMEIATIYSPELDIKIETIDTKSNIEDQNYISVVSPCYEETSSMTSKPSAANLSTTELDIKVEKIETFDTKSNIEDQNEISVVSPCYEETSSKTSKPSAENLSTTELDIKIETINTKSNIEDQNEMSVVSPCYEETSSKTSKPSAANLSTKKNGTSTNLLKNRYRPHRKKLIYKSQAAEKYRQSLEEKNKIKKDYYEKKILLLERIALAKEKSANARELLALNTGRLLP